MREKNRVPYPSATKMSPVLATATSVGLQKCVASLPGVNAVPSVSEGFSSPGGTEHALDECGLEQRVQRTLEDLVHCNIGQPRVAFAVDA